ncbi:ABC transporter ATP-binding protein [Bosea sp. (in: a-proteobacteria)]|uniref:ABC transporter ATP-binding protein n=1 Tax=Bosea sp. (in: a-proteobacteria) TaxID=1871050 RepID=UPI0025BD4675|nr:ABC transporter ATP-binding protein [Bosea sp. (in: a-proteobacteria)]
MRTRKPMKTAGAGDDILSVNDIEVVYGRIAVALKGVSLRVPRGGIAALLGPNGAGKTTTLKAIARLLQTDRGEVSRGTILFEGERIDALPPNALVQRGCILVMEGRHCFGRLSIEDNLLTGASTRSDGAQAIRDDLEKIYGLFPRLKERRHVAAGYTSGGEQQMCAIGRALMSRPKLILLDEPSLGLAPQVVEHIFEIIARIVQTESVSILLAEQNANLALHYAQLGYVMEAGRVAMSAPAVDLRADARVREVYLGMGQGSEGFRSRRPVRTEQRWLI